MLAARALAHSWPEGGSLPPLAAKRSSYAALMSMHGNSPWQKVLRREHTNVRLDSVCSVRPSVGRAGELAGGWAGFGQPPSPGVQLVGLGD